MARRACVIPMYDGRHIGRTSFQCTTSAIPSGLHQPARYSPLSAYRPRRAPPRRRAALVLALLGLGRGHCGIQAWRELPRVSLLVRGNSDEAIPEGVALDTPAVSRPSQSI